VGGFVYQHQPEEIAIQTSSSRGAGWSAIVRVAFELRGEEKWEEARDLQ